MTTGDPKRVAACCQRSKYSWKLPNARTQSGFEFGEPLLLSFRPGIRATTASLEANGATGAAARRRFDPGSDRRLWPGCSGRAAVCRMSLLVLRITGRCSSLASKRRYCTQLSGRRCRSEDCAHGAGHECGSCSLAGLRNDSRLAVKPQVGVDGHAKQLELRCDRQSASGDVDSSDVGS